jgi:uncharacterized protein (DUF305 family)
MRWHRAARGLVTAVALSAVTGLTACTDQPGTGTENAPVIVPGKPGEPARTIPRDQVSAPPAVPPNEADLRYVQDMIVHHQQAVEMARLVPERGSDERVKRLADRIGGTQGPEIAMMNAWLRANGKPTVEPVPTGHGEHTTMPGMATPAQLDTLRAARGPTFDRAFLELMIAHHQGALTMAGRVQTAGADVRVQEMADEVIATQRDEINIMRGMLAS